MVRCEEEFLADEQVLRSGAPAVRVVTLADVALSVGVGVRGDAEYLARARAAGITVVRRTSGGTGVLHGTGDLAWSVVLPRTDPRVGSDYVHGYGRLGAGVLRFLDGLGLPAAWGPPPNLVPGFCVLSGRGQVLTVEGRILGGAAQHVTRSALLHQGMVALAVDRERIAELFEISHATLTERLTGLRELGVATAPDALAEKLAREITENLANSRE
jgi:lipoate-protein ligase A